MRQSNIYKNEHDIHQTLPNYDDDQLILTFFVVKKNSTLSLIEINCYPKDTERFSEVLI